MEISWSDFIVTSPEVVHGQPRFKGTRIMVYLVLENLAAGATSEELRDDFPSLPPEAVPAALAYAADLARDRIVPITAA